jgi:CHAD domain-containing protein
MEVSSIDVEGKKERRFCWDFPDSDFARRIGPVIEMRAILAIAEMEKKIDTISMCNEDDKTVGRIEFESLNMMDSEHCVIRCRLLPLKGYGKEFRKIGEILKKQKLAREQISAAVELLQESGADPGAYSSKVNVALQPEMTAETAVRLIMERLVSVMHQNLEGVQKDIDTEFLHDLRVAIRRARSLIGQTKGVLDEDTTHLLQKELKTMGDATGAVRDLDVYLLQKESYLLKLPEALKGGGVQLFRVLQRKRRTARDRMAKVMEGSDFGNALAALDLFVKSESSARGNAAMDVPVGELAKTVIWKRFRRILRKGRQISDDTPDEKLHELRIDCKKLRYLLEFFISLFPEEEMKRLIKQLKGLQENLGDFNDLSVQQDFLAGYLSSVSPRNSQSIWMAGAIGGLIFGLAEDHKRVRSEFMGVFHGFSSGENEARFRMLFK